MPVDPLNFLRKSITIVSLFVEGAHFLYHEKNTFHLSPVFIQYDPLDQGTDE